MARAPQRWSLFASHFSKNAKRLQQSFSDGAWKISRTGGRRCVLSGSILDIVVLDRHEVAQGMIIFHRYASDRSCDRDAGQGQRHPNHEGRGHHQAREGQFAAQPTPAMPAHASCPHCRLLCSDCTAHTPVPAHLPTRRRGATESRCFVPRACAGVPQRAAAQAGGGRWRACRRRQRRRGLLYAVRPAGHRHASGGGLRSSRARSGDWVEPQQWR